jgi:hypothetical protein
VWFSPRKLARHLRSLLTDGPPAAPIDTGVAYGAKGTSSSDATGDLIDYTVAANDNATSPTIINDAKGASSVGQVWNVRSS